MATASLNREGLRVEDSNDSIVIISDLSDLPSGRTLDMSSWDGEYVSGGHIIKRNTVTGEYAPLGVSDGAYVALGTNEEYVGVLKRSVLKNKPFAPIMVIGTVNAKACPYPVSAAIKAALPQIKFLYA